MNDLSPSIRIAGLLLFIAITTRSAVVEAADPLPPIVKVVEGGESRLKPEDVIRPDYLRLSNSSGWILNQRGRSGLASMARADAVA